MGQVQESATGGNSYYAHSTEVTKFPVFLLTCRQYGARDFSRRSGYPQSGRGWWMAVIELPPKSKSRPAGKKRGSGAKAKPVLCLPKGLVDAGEKALEAALREVREETGV